MKEVGGEEKLSDGNKNSVRGKMNKWERAAWNVTKEEEKQHKPWEWGEPQEKETKEEREHRKSGLV